MAAVPVLIEGAHSWLRSDARSTPRDAGRDHASDIARYNRVLNQARWLARARVRLPLVASFAPSGPAIIGVDNTLERRWVERIAARGIYRDLVRSSHGHFVKTSGLRRMLLLALAPWAGCVWSLFFLTVLAPSERYAQELRHKHES